MLNCPWLWISIRKQYPFDDLSQILGGYIPLDPSLGIIVAKLSGIGSETLADNSHIGSFLYSLSILFIQILFLLRIEKPHDRFEFIIKIAAH